MIESFSYTYSRPEINDIVVDKPLPEDIAEQILLNEPVHVDHEGFDLNKIEQLYYTRNGIQLTKDDIWYKDGGKENGANSVIHTWFKQDEDISCNLIIDHSQFVFHHPIVGEAREQILRYASQRPELLRILSTSFKCGLDMCIDYINFSNNTIEPIVHIEWDFTDFNELSKAADEVEHIINSKKWLYVIPAILRYNELAKVNKIDAFDQADTRAMIIFGRKAYKLIPTL
jgi:hypothetical protein